MFLRLFGLLSQHDAMCCTHDHDYDDDNYHRRDEYYGLSDNAIIDDDNADDNADDNDDSDDFDDCSSNSNSINSIYVIYNCR